MAKAEATVQKLVGMIERGELRLSEMQRRKCGGPLGCAIGSIRPTAVTRRARPCSGRR